MSEASLLLMAVGLCAGVLSGLLGIGGGIILVPALFFVLSASLPVEMVMKVALATSLATIPFTSAFASWQQYKAGNSDYVKVKQLAVGVAVGGIVGGVSAAMVSSTLLKAIFCIFALYVGMQMLIGAQPRLKVTFNRTSAMMAGLITGAMSSWVGIGGGNILVPFLSSTGETIKKAAGITSPIGVVVAIFASLGFAASAVNNPTNLPGLLGFVHVAGFFAIVSTSLVGVFFGVKLSDKVPAAVLKKIFAVLLLGTGLKLSWSLLA